MSTVGIIAEYDPFHYGHLYQLQKARELTGADQVVIVLGGDFLQRGMPAMADKGTRARMAVDAGADLVLSLPCIYSVNSAREYARGAVGILAGIYVPKVVAVVKRYNQFMDQMQGLSDKVGSVVNDGTIGLLESMKSVMEKLQDLLGRFGF